MRSRWKRNAVIGTMVVLVGAAAALNWRYTNLDRLEFNAGRNDVNNHETGTRMLGEAARVSAASDMDSDSDSNFNSNSDSGASDEESVMRVSGTADGNDIDNSGEDLNNNNLDNISLAEDSVGLLTDEGAVYTGADYFASARLTRQQARDNAISLLQEAANQEDAGEAVLNEASEGIQVLASYTLKEAQIENLVTAKGYQDCVAFMGSDSVSVVVSNGEGELSREDVARIADIAMTETGFPASGVRVMAAS